MKTLGHQIPARQIDVDTPGPVERVATPGEPDAFDLLSAPMATLAYVAEGKEAETLVASVVERILAHEEAGGTRRRRRRAADLQGFSRAVGAILGDLLVHPPSDGQGALVYRSTQANSFSRGPVAYRPFKAALGALVKLELVEKTAGFYDPKRFDWGDGVVSGQGRASRFRATASLLDIAADHGVIAGAAREHFRLPPPNRVIILKAKSGRVGRVKVRGGRLDVPDKPEVRRLGDQVRQIDAFLRSVEIAGGSHQGFVRQFEHGDQPGFNWNKGGRLYSTGPGNYQTLNKASRLAMRFDGEQVVEIDIKASYLTILHGKLGVRPEFGADPYEIDGVPREVVKGWLVATFGAEKSLQRWPQIQVAEYATRKGRRLGQDYPVKAVGEKLLARYPVLGRAREEGLGWPDLMFTESEVVIRTMLTLLKDGTPSMPVHDSLIVPASETRPAVDALRESFNQILGVEVLVEVTGSIEPGSPPTPILPSSPKAPQHNW